MMELTPKMTTAIEDVSAKLQILDPQWLTNLINFETGGTFNPKASNPRSSAKGLIQFIDSTAQSLGFESSFDLVNKYPDFASQLQGPVYQYLRSYAPFREEYQLYMAVFYPAARKYTADTPFRKIFNDRIKDPAKAEKAYKAFINANPGILTPQDYVNLLKKKAGQTIFRGNIPGIVTILAIVGISAWLLSRKIL